jgi:hypothetical protein
LGRQLTEKHRHEMVPGTEASSMILGLCIGYGFLKFKSRNHL